MPEPEAPDTSFDGFDDMVPEGAMIQGGLRVVFFLEPDGSDSWAYSCTEGLSIASLIGSLERLKHSLIQEAEEAEDD